uniref:Uncharacterized protein n=1 Tax=Trichuris muris TaxID=70415 RepID=A0A5S6QMN2_TRIMR
MGSSLSSMVAEIFMEHLEGTQMTSSLQKKGEENILLEHLNNMFLDSIVFTMEKETEGQPPFADVLVMRESQVYRKPTHR